ncbi:MAG: protein serine/threonine phosphatase [Bacteroidetes bacterium]|jgi:serine phosphatase RsbU (regulator of sigma subunit)|nr:protein serine/threonine phosphatase [Bacteroidota bacterium]
MKKVLSLFIVLIHLCAFGQGNDSSFVSLKAKIAANPKDTSLVNGFIRKLTRERKNLPVDSIIAHCSFIYDVSKKNNNGDGIGFAAVTLGNIYTSNGDYSKALLYLFEAEKQYIRLNKPAKLAKVYNVIGNTYLGLENEEGQMKFFTKCYEISLANNLPEQEALGAAGLANSYTSAKNYRESNKWNFIAEKLFRQQKYVIGYTIVLENIADNYYQLGELDKAMEYSKLSEQGLAEANFNYASYGCYKGRGNIYEKKKNYKEAISNYKLALDYILKDKANHNIAEIYKLLSDASRNAGQFRESVQFLNLHIQYKDSVFNEDSKHELLEVEKKYETEKKDAEIRILNKENDLNKSELGKKKILIYAGAICMIFLVGMVVFIFRSNVQKNKANRLLARQKVIIEEKQKEILDSIHYAKRIQDGLLEHQDLLRSNVQDSFILFSPKDIVSGDFYWTYRKDDLFYLAVCDSTGHGVPGAFMSLLNIGFLNEAINEKQLRKPNEIFDYVRERLIRSISKDGQKDGFDGILLCLDHRSNKLTYAAANNAPMLISGGVIVEQEKNKMPVGKGEITAPFDLFTLEWKKGDMLYLYTDGYADQFGGPKGKKFKYKQLIDLLVSTHTLPPDQQSEILHQKFVEWKGNLEQIDDVCIIGISL